MPAARSLLVCALALVAWSAEALPMSGGRSSSNHSKVLIIGAGAAGYAAASRLMENNFYDLTILEAENRIGGRVHTVRFAENIVELGAEEVHGEVGNVVYEMAEPLELLSHQTKAVQTDMAFVWSGGALADQTEVEMLFNASLAIGSRRDNLDQLVNFTGSYGEWFLDQFQQRLMTMERRPAPDLVDRFLGWFEKFVAFYDGSDTWYNTSAQGLLHYKECEGDLMLSWKRSGYRTVFDLLTKRYPNPAQELPVRRRVQLGSEVATIRWAERVYGPEPYGYNQDPYREPYQEPYQDPYQQDPWNRRAPVPAAALRPEPAPVPEVQTEAHPDVETEAPTAAQTEAQTEVQTEVQTEASTATEAQTETAQTEAQTETQPTAQQHNEVTEASDAETTTPATEMPQGDDPMAGYLLSDDPMTGYLEQEEAAAAAPRPPIVVELANGARYTADMVLVTVSLGVLKHSADVLFDPPLPQRKMNAVRNLGFGQVNKLFLYFSEPWWPSSMSGFSVLVTEDDLEQFKRKYPQYGRRGHWVQGLSGFYIDQHKPNVVLMDWIVGEPARVMESYSDYQIMMGCKHWLEMYLGHNYSIPVPIGFTRSKWWSNPHFRGSYSYRSLDSDRAGAWAAHLAEPILDRQGTPAVMFAGEATHDSYYSTVHGAIETGWREADRILHTLKSEGRFRTSYSQDRDRLRS